MQGTDSGGPQLLYLTNGIKDWQGLKEVFYSGSLIMDNKTGTEGK